MRIALPFDKVSLTASFQYFLDFEFVFFFFGLGVKDRQQRKC